MRIETMILISRRHSVGFARTILSTALLAACSASGQSAPEAAIRALDGSEDSCEHSASALLRDANGAGIGAISFHSDEESTYVVVSAHLPPGQGGVHGMHIHANDNPGNGAGCIADPEQPSSTHFTSADGHYNPEGEHHGHHGGDLPAVYFTDAGEASMQFLTDRFHAPDLVGRVVILHQLSDNYGNVPVGDNPDQYTPNGPEASDLTARTGNAGARIGCGVIE